MRPALLAATFALAGAAPSAAQPPPVFRAEVGVVRVEVSVTSRNAPLRGLPAAEFELRDDGRPQAVRLVVEEQVPVDTVMVLDTSGSVRGARLAALKRAAASFLEGLRPGEQAALVAFREDVRLVEPFSAERARVRAALEPVEPGGGTALRDAIYAGLRLRASPGSRRTAVVVFSDGVDNVSILGRAQVREAASRSDAIVYAVAVRPPGERPQSFLREVVEATGGRLSEAEGDRDLQDRFLDVLADIRSRYVLSYAPEGPDTPGWHALQVRLRRAKGEVLARPGYWR